MTVTDLKSAKDLAPSVLEIKKFQKNKKGAHPIKFILGKHRLEDFRDVDMVFKAAGVPLDSVYITEARKNGVPVFMDDALFAREAPCQIIGITGTRGKTTTSNLIYEIAKTTGKKIYFGGNVRGMATLPLLEKVKKNNLVILELSSWQLQGWRDLKISPEISVVTNIYPDHQNYYKNSMAKYVYDKEAIFANQTKNDFLVLNKNCAWCRKMAKKAKSKVVWFSANDVPRGWKLKILGEHNLENIAAAVAVGKLLRLPVAKIKKVVENFRGVPGRLEFVREVRGVKYYNDTTSTMPEATIAALRAIGGKNIILICGGADKNLNMEKFAQVILEKVKGVVFLKGQGTEKIMMAMKKNNPEISLDDFPMVESMEKAVELASREAEKGDVVLLSPGASSFGLFANEFDRGDKFKEAVKRLK